MDKKEQIKFLEEKLKRATEDYLLAEVDYRTLQSMIMGKYSTSKELLAIETKMKMEVSRLQTRLRHFRALIEEIKNGKAYF